ncbi:aldo/keto reductase [Micromonospora carbonacea]|uniref:Aldo/keto reductase n=1 Tax=Micromonospora carbonacea TaxID=47853 RepID=A0A7H8XJM8_9ACTN|nr:aldo/keto reductase [Micromonospora carbonacea]MBB5827714.1 aryl-alcohol dehydrogenase-like predicted oxidoreductase [Micromonospora carbonacea]QLD24559.1 aldo/keto reductase [Micromonospora carbonacea]
MEYVKLGATGLDVSPLCLGGMSFGDPARGGDPWTLDEDGSRDIVRRALDHGINFFDTANAYSDGSGEEILGRLLRQFARRDEVVVATKVFLPMRPGPNGSGLSRKAILAEVDNSLRRLGLDHVDLYQVHRWDHRTPIEETLEALHDVVRAGKVRYLGASSMYAWQFGKALHTARLHGWTPFVSMQNYYNLMYREEEREMLPLCADQGIGVLPWSPLARGKLAREWTVETTRARHDDFGRSLYAATESADRRVVERVGEIAAELCVTRAQVALAWLRRQPAVTAPVIGVTSVKHLDETVASLDVTLSDDDLWRLAEPYVPHAVVGHE